MHNPRPIKIWDGIQCHISHNVRIVHYIIDCLLHRVRNSRRGKCADIGGTPQTIGNMKQPTLFSNSILCARERVLHAAPDSIWHYIHHQRPAPGPAPMDRTINVSAAGTAPKEASPQWLLTVRIPNCPVQPLPRYTIPATIHPIPGTATHGRPGWTRRTQPRKTQMSRKHAGNPHQQNKTIHNIKYFFTCGYDVDHPGI